MAVDPNDPRITRARPGWALVILASPIVLFVLVALSYALLVGFGLRGRAASGEQVAITFTACPDARAHIEGRVADMGLADAVFEDTADGFVLHATLPGDPEVAAAVPATLATPGHLEVRYHDEVLATEADVIDAGVRMDVFMMPSTLLRLRAPAAERLQQWTRDNQEGRLSFVLDGVVIGSQTATNPVGAGELEIATSDLKDRQRMLSTAAWSVVIDHGPLPCEVTVAP